MKRIVLVEYIGNSDSEKKPVGHSLKVITEYRNMLLPEFRVVYAVPFNMIESEEIKNNLLIVLPNIRMLSVLKRNFRQKILEKKHVLENLRTVFERSVRDDIIWFANVDIHLFYFLFFHRQYCKQCICTIYQNDFRKKGLVGYIRNKLFLSVAKKLKLLIVTNENFFKQSCNNFFMPDYYYDEKKYERYSCLKKKNRIVCLGTMNRDKKLAEIIECFNDTEYELVIAGRFYDKQWKNELDSFARDNISIKDEYLSYERYLSLLSEAQYTIVPYDTKAYYQRTSGVLQEAIFMRTIPIAPKSLLEFNQCNGIGFDDYGELNIQVLKKFNTSEFNQWCEKIIVQRYSYEKISNGLKNKLLS